MKYKMKMLNWWVQNVRNESNKNTVHQTFTFIMKSDSGEKSKSDSWKKLFGRQKFRGEKIRYCEFIKK